MENEHKNLGQIEEQLLTCNSDDEDERPELEDKKRVKENRIETRRLQLCVGDEDLEILQNAVSICIRDLAGRDRGLAEMIPKDLVVTHRRSIAKARASNLVKHLMRMLATMEQSAPFLPPRPPSPCTQRGGSCFSFSPTQLLMTISRILVPCGVDTRCIGTALWCFLCVPKL